MNGEAYEEAYKRVNDAMMDLIARRMLNKLLDYPEEEWESRLTDMCESLVEDLCNRIEKIAGREE